MSVKSKHSAGRNEKSSKRAKRKKVEDSDDLESSEEELDLTKECHPIGHYIHDRAEMIDQMFSVIKGNKLKAMLPPILKDCDIDLLKLKCLDQLLGMSDRRITSILDGRVLESSSESYVETNDCDSDRKRTSSSASNKSDEPSRKRYRNTKRLKRKGKRKHKALGEGKKSGSSESNLPEKGKTLLEILELEMRARAIRALLKQNEAGQDDSGLDVEIVGDTKGNDVGEVAHEVVDLTGCEDDELPEKQESVTNPEALADKKTYTFEEKVNRSQTEKGNQDEEKAKRTQNRVEMQNRLFKKVYRLKQHRLRKEEGAKQDASEEPEEGELTSSEDGVQMNRDRDSKMRPKVKMSYTEECETYGSESNTDTEPKTRSKEGDAEGNVADTSKECKNTESVVEEPTRDNAESKNDKTDKSECPNLENDAPKTQDTTTNATSTSTPAGESESLPTADLTSWRERWLQKDGVQKLVKSSKIYAKVKKRIAEKTQRSKEEMNVANEAKSESNASEQIEVIEGSIKEYEKLVGKTAQSS